MAKHNYKYGKIYIIFIVSPFEAVRDVSKWSERMRAPMEATYGKEGFEKVWHAWVDGILQFLTTKNGDICKAVSNMYLKSISQIVKIVNFVKKIAGLILHRVTIINGR